jgi:hypothetical protein
MNTHDSVPVRGQIEPLEARVDDGQTIPSYREPQLFAIGTAVDLMRSDSRGNAKDSRHWYVYP